MNVIDYEETISKIRKLPEPLLQEVSDYVDFLIMKRNINYWQIWKPLSDSLNMAETDFSDYLGNLQDYEEKLARGEVKW
jgi:hypothetical protein